MNLSQQDKTILEHLSEQDGLRTRQIAEYVSYSASNNRMRSAAVGAWLRRLKSIGLVGYLDDQKPICWIRTKAGTEVLDETNIDNRRHG